MDDMTDGITFERVTRTDLDGIVGLAQAAWYSPDGLGDLAAGTLDEAGLNGDEREVAARLLATDEVASYLAESTWGMKALLDGQVVGIILTQGTHASAEASAYWEGVGQQAREAAERLLARAREREERATEPSEPVYLDEARATDEMRAEAGLANQPRVLLLVVGEAARPWAQAACTGPRPLLASRRRALLARHGHGLRLALLRASWARATRRAHRRRRGRARALLRLWRARLEERGGASTKRRPRFLVRNPSCARARAAFFENDVLT